MEHRDASNSPPGSYMSRKYGYDVEGHLIEMQLYDEANALIYLERYSYEGGQKMIKITEADGETSKITYTYDEQGRLDREILYSPAGKPYAAIVYTYELY
jgi:YD repeat-containing protein